MSKKKLVVIGGGAAGFFCAINAATLNPDLDVMIIERSSKLLITGFSQKIFLWYLFANNIDL